VSRKTAGQTEGTEKRLLLPLFKTGPDDYTVTGLIAPCRKGLVIAEDHATQRKFNENG